MMRALWPWLRLLIAAGILGVLAWRLGTGAFLDGLRVIDAPAILAALAIGLLTTVPGAWRWCLVARNLGLPLRLGRAVSDCYRAFLLNAVLPAGILGDVHRAVRHGRQSGDVGRGVRAVVLEKIANQVILILAAVAAVLSRPELVSAVVGQRAASIVTTGVAGVLGIVVVVVIVLAAWNRWGSPAWPRPLVAALTEARDGLLSRRTWPAIMLLSVAAVAGHVAMFVVAARVAGSPVSLAQLVPLAVLSLIVTALPVNFGGWGPREGFLALTFGAWGLGAAQGLTVAVVFGVLTLVSSLPGAVVLLAESQALSRSFASVYSAVYSALSGAFYSMLSRTVRYSAKDSTSAARTSLPFRAEARDGRPMTPDSV